MSIGSGSRAEKYKSVFKICSDLVYPFPPNLFSSHPWWVYQAFSVLLIKTSGLSFNFQKADEFEDPDEPEPQPSQ